jgi:subtilase family serine protease
VLAIADADNALVETQEGNNVKASGTIRIGPDLLVSALTVPAASTAGAAITIADTTANQGGGSAAASTTTFYLSSNGALDASDVLLGSRAVSALSAGASESGNTTVTLPSSTVAGLWYVIAKADGPGAIVETQELNNQRTSLAIKVGPDLVLSSVVAPAITGAGTTIVVSDTTKNQGAGSAAPSTTAFYWSTDLTIDPSDVLLGTRAVGPLAPGAVDSGSISVQVPSSSATGNYFVIAKCDNANVVAESVESNNTANSLVTRVGPDLTITALTAPASAAAGATITISDSTKNTGGGAADASATRYYLSTNGALDASDMLLGSRDVPALAAGASAAGSAAVTIPAGTAPGTYYIIAAADGAGVVVETSESNNTRIFGIRVTQ